MVLQQDSQCFTGMQVFFKEMISFRCNTLRVIWSGDHMSMDDIYWQDGEVYSSGAFCIVTQKFNIAQFKQKAKAR